MRNGATRQARPRRKRAYVSRVSLEDENERNVLIFHNFRTPASLNSPAGSAKMAKAIREKFNEDLKILEVATLRSGWR